MRYAIISDIHANLEAFTAVLEIYNSESMGVRLYRAAYDIAATQAKMLKCGLPAGLISRLSYGR